MNRITIRRRPSPMAKKASARPQAESVATADRVLAVLTAFRRGDRALSLAELAERTDLVKSTILRLLVSLESYGLIIRLHDGNYQLGAEVLRLGSIFQQSLELETHVMPVLQDLVDETEESASFYVRHGNQRLCAYRVDSPHRLRLHIQPGDILPMDLSAIARVLKAFAKWPDDTTAAQIDLPIYSSGATDPHTAAIAMPVFGANLRLVGALALSGPVTRLTPDRAQEIRVYLYAAAMRLTKSLGGTFETPQTRRMAGE